MATVAEIIFGSRITRVLGWIAEEASLEGTVEAFEKASLMTQGIQRLMMTLNDAGTDIALNNFQKKLMKCVESEDARRAAKAAYRKGE